jgi:hypothetical protein
MDVASTNFARILACEAGGGLDRVVIREGSRATPSPLLGPQARMWLVIRHICEQSYATWTSGSAICHAISPSLLYTCLSASLLAITAKSPRLTRARRHDDISQHLKRGRSKGQYL